MKNTWSGMWCVLCSISKFCLLENYDNFLKNSLICFTADIFSFLELNPGFIFKKEQSNQCCNNVIITL